MSGGVCWGRVRAGWWSLLLACLLHGAFAPLGGAEGSGDNASSAATPSAPAPTSPTAGEFYSVSCHSHVYQLSAASFASVWMLCNVAVFLCAFGVFMKECCYRSFTYGTSQGY